MVYDEEKFKEYNRLLREEKEFNLLVIASPEVLGDNYEELIENLRRLSNSGLHLCIVPPRRREKPK